MRLLDQLEREGWGGITKQWTELYRWDSAHGEVGVYRLNNDQTDVYVFVQTDDGLANLGYFSYSLGVSIAQRISIFAGARTAVWAEEARP